MTNWQAGLLDPIYEDNFMATDGIIITVAGTRLPSMRVIDKTTGITMALAGGGELQSLTPAATVRMAELIEKGIEVAHVKTDIFNGHIELNGRRWRISNTRFEPTGGGTIADGEVYLLLSGEAVL